MSRGTGFARKVYERAPAAPARPLERPVVVARITSVVKAVPKSPRAENKHLLSMARGRPCLIRSPICDGGTDTTVACHGGGVANGKGTGYKVGDHLTAWGCHCCNHYTDAYGGATRAQKTAAFMAGHLRQVLAWRAIVADQSQPPKDRAAARWALDHLNATPVGQGDTL
ncbi:nuclease domain-containing protein [Variovorax ginsengisoli]|uniref:DUF1364 family protein n=1 Tax=Variovorax ginsengisoli TaxID=363844 RepID=A0ABT8SE57_9BURK|nr:nuclease domain-containing protein [Variovorax ginsengisoli]MDN8617845.1 DUF1364 family protein [Variovorax ginsengisoli]MDO1537015.1 DUF1364 family protein [Variovorax ginsengisoli]